MKKHCPYRLTPHGVRIPKHHIKRMPPLEKDSSTNSLDQSLLSIPLQININHLNIFPRKAIQPPIKKKVEVIDVIDCKEVGCNDNQGL